MDYTLAGQFLEACDCTVICPCWVDDDPVGGHCTGFILWDLGTVDGQGDSRIDGHPVTGCRVVSVSTHSGKRRDKSSTTTVIYVDTADQHRRGLVELLGQAFAGTVGGPLADLAGVSGTVVDVQPAHISPLPKATGAKDGWSVEVVACARPDDKWNHRDQDEQHRVVQADGRPEVFDEKARRKANLSVEPLTLEHTALSYELRTPDKVVVQAGEHLVVDVGALPGGSLEVTGRSGMRGAFAYRHPAAADSPHRPLRTVLWQLVREWWR